MRHVRNEVVGLVGSPRDVAKTFTYNQVVMTQSSIYSGRSGPTPAGGGGINLQTGSRTPRIAQASKLLDMDIFL